MKTAVFSTQSYDKEFLEKANADRQHELVFFESPLNDKTVQLACGYKAVCVFVNDILTREVVEDLAELGVKLIVLRCAGFNNVDIKTAAKHHITVLRVPAYSPTSVAEHAVALILTLNRKTHKAYNRVREGNFSIEHLDGFELAGKIVGVIGTGRIGAAFASIMKGFGCNVIAYDKHPKKELENGGVHYCSLNEVFQISDIISLHCPLTPETNQLINKDSLNLMKKGVMLINTSRGKLIDTNAIIRALKHGKVAYLGADVYEQEENLFFKDLSDIIILDDKISRLMTLPNVLITAHQAFFTDVGLTQISQTTLKNLRDFEKGTIDTQNEVSVSMIK